MDALRIIKKIESDNIQINGLKDYIGSNAEIIILINSGNISGMQTGFENAMSVISNYEGQLKSWTREELHDR